MKRIILIGTIALALAGCDSSKRVAEAAVRNVLKDPTSAQFGDFYYNSKTKKGCLTVNAKNSMGGYDGDQQAYVKRTDSGWENEGIADIRLDECQSIFADTTS